MHFHHHRPHLQMFGRKMPMPKTVLGRRIVGGLLIIGGLLGFLPILGFWMLPLGIFVFSYDSHTLRRWRRRADVWLRRRWRASRFSRYNKSKQI